MTEAFMCEKSSVRRLKSVLAVVIVASLASRLMAIYV
jgi:hypothetical protein